MSRWICGLFLVCLTACIGQAQDPRSSQMIGLYRDSMAPGEIGRNQIERDMRLRGFFQPVDVRGPKGSRIALASDGAFGESIKGAARAGFLVGAVYRVKVENIPGEEGVELYPSIEIIDRLYAPPEREHRFPIPIVLEQEDLDRAIKGDMITRVIYLEDSQIATPISYADGIQRVYEASAKEDAIRVADQLGRPVAIVRIGSRVPDATGIDHQFLYGCPPWVTIKDIPDQEAWFDKHGWPRFELPAAGEGQDPAGSEESPSDQRRLDAPPREARRKTMRIGG